MSTEITKGFDYEGLPRQFMRDSRKRAKQIIDLDQSMGRSMLTMGPLLKEQRDAFGSIANKQGLRGDETWHAWVQQELGWKTGRRYANTIIKIHEHFHDVTLTSSLGYVHMKALATDDMPPAIKEKVIQMANEGNCPTEAEIRAMKQVATGKKPTPTDAKATAQATGEPQIASDGRIYTPLTDDAADVYTERRDLAYSIIDAVTEISSCQISPKEWLGQADEHWLNDLTLASIEQATDWLTNLIVAYKQAGNIIDGK